MKDEHKMWNRLDLSKRLGIFSVSIAISLWIVIRFIAMGMFGSQIDLTWQDYWTQSFLWTLSGGPLPPWNGVFTQRVTPKKSKYATRVTRVLELNASSWMHPYLYLSQHSSGFNFEIFGGRLGSGRAVPVSCVEAGIEARRSQAGKTWAMYSLQLGTGFPFKRQFARCSTTWKRTSTLPARRSSPDHLPPPSCQSARSSRTLPVNSASLPCCCQVNGSRNGWVIFFI